MQTSNDRARWTLVALLALGAAAPSLAGGFRFEPGEIDPGMNLGSGIDPRPLPDARRAADEAAAPDPAPRFASADLVALEADLTGAFDFDGTELAILDVGVQWFVADGLSAGIFAEGIYATEEFDEAVGGGGGVLLRWHFVREERFTLFAEVGCAAVWFTDPVPADGSDFNFSPRASVGASLPLGDVARLDARVGWFHLSNAQTSADNPGIDALAVGVGLVFPF